MRNMDPADFNKFNLNLPMKMYLNIISEFSALSEDEENSLFIRKAKGDECTLQKLLEANYCLVTQLSKEYAEKGVPLEDLIFDGNNALVEAINTFDLNSGSRFREYARTLIIKALDNVQKEHDKAPNTVIDQPIVEWEE